MFTFKIQYLNYESDVKTLTFESSEYLDIGEVIYKVISEDISDGDGIFQVISCIEEN